MTLDETIKHAEEVAEEYKEKLKVYENINKDRLLFAEEETECRLGAEAHGQLAEWLKELKQLREQTQWIPVSERLPKIADVYRVTRYYPNNVMNPKYIVDACAFDGSNTWYNDNRINHERAYVDNVIAWQENPEPYKPEKGD